MAGRRGRPRKSAQELSEKVTEAVKDVKTTAESAVEAVGETAEKVVAKAGDVVQAVEAKRRGRKPGSTSKAAEDKTVEIGNFFEIDGQQIQVEDVITKIQEAYKTDGHRIGSIKSMQVYYNFSERRAYYVINGKAEDKFVTF